MIKDLYTDNDQKWRFAHAGSIDTAYKSNPVMIGRVEIIKVGDAVNVQSAALRKDVLDNDEITINYIKERLVDNRW